MVTDNAAALRRWSDTPSGILSDINPSDSALDMTSTAAYGSVAEQTITPQAKGGGMYIHQLDSRLDSKLVDKTAGKLLRAAQQTIEKGVYDFLAATFGTLVDNAYSSGGTSAICSSPAAGVYPQSGGFHYDSSGDGTSDAQYATKITTALSSSGLSAARELMRKQKTFKGIPAGFGMGPLTIVVPVELEDEAVQATRSAEFPQTFSAGDENGFAATGAAVNPHFLRNYNIVTSGFLSGDANDWWLVDASNESPLKVWVPEVGKPTLNIWVNPATGNTELSCSFYLKVFCDTPVAGIVGSSVS